MKKIISFIAALCVAASAFSVSAEIYNSDTPAELAAADKGKVIRIHPGEASPFNKGEFQGWGTALCWWANRVGYSEKMTEQAAGLFFSEDGLGLDIARYNLGGGDNPEHNHITRSDSKVPGVWNTFELSEDGKDVTMTYDITKDQNQLNIAKAALKANPNLYIEGFSNSAPYFMTKTGCTGGGDPAKSDNLNPDMYDDFGRFIADATKLFKDEGIIFQSYSPMNEPDTDYWGVNSPKQEGCHFDPGTSQSNAIIETRKALDNAGLTDVIVAGMDETDINKSVANYPKLSDEAKAALGRIDTHTYSGSQRAELKNMAVNANKDLWMSEVDKGGDGFTLASMIINDMNGMQPAAWVMWDIIDKHKDADFTAPDGSKTEANNTLNYTDSLWGVGMADHDNEEILLTNKYYVFGQFSRYIKPGMTIISSSANSLAAYDKKTGRIVIVALNNNNTAAKTTFDLRDFNDPANNVQVIRTDASSEKWAVLDDIEVVDRQFTTDLKAKSVTTFVIDAKKDTPTPAVTDTPTPAVTENPTPAAYITSLTADKNGLSYTYSVPENMAEYNKYFAVYNENNELVNVTVNESSKSFEGDYDKCTVKLIVWDGMKPVQNSETEVKQTTEPTISPSINPSVEPTVVPTEEPSPKVIKYMTITGDEQLTVGGKSKYSASVTVDDVLIDGVIKWSVSDETVASINENGELTALKGGDVTITAVCEEAGTSTAIDLHVADYSDKYAGSEYTFVKNIGELTNDFKTSLKGFVTSGFAGLANDDDGEPVLMPQNSLSNKDNTQRAGSAVLTLETPFICGSGQIINMSFDMYTPNSLGDSTFSLTSSDGTALVDVIVNNWGNKYSIKIGGTDVETNGDGATYFKNKQGDKDNSIHINRGGHVEIYYTPSTGDIILTVKNVSGDAAEKVYTGTVPANKDIAAVKFAGEYTQWNKQMAVDNLLTNVLSGNILAGSAVIEGTARVGETLEVKASELNAAVKYQWQANTGSNGDYENIENASESTYTVSESLIGKNIKCILTSDEKEGTIETAPTFPVIAKDAELPQITGRVTISGDAKIGKILTAEIADLTVGATAKYQWQVSNNDGFTDIENAAGNKLELTDEYIGKKVRCVVTADGLSGSISSAETEEIIKTPITGTVTVTGDARATKTLTATVSGLNEDAKAKYQWQINTASDSEYINIENAVSDKLKLTNEYIGKKVKCIVTADNFDGRLESEATEEIQDISLEGILTNDFSNDAGAFELTGDARLCTDASNNAVLGIQSVFSNKDGVAQTGSAVFISETPFICDEGKSINIAFDYYCSNSGGKADIILGNNDIDLLKLEMSSWDHYSVKIGDGDAVTETNGAKIYLRNGVNDKNADQLISNGAHIEIVYTPSTGDIKMSVKNNKNTSAETKTYTGNIADAEITKLAFNANLTTWSKPVYLDNLVTTIVDSNV